MMEQFQVWMVDGRRCLVREDLETNLHWYFEFLGFLS